MTQRPSPFATPTATPYDPAYGLHVVAPFRTRPWEFDGWKPETLSWKKTCYIHAGLSGRNVLVFTGPDALAFLSGICVNGFSKFPVGSARHAVMCTGQGLIAAHGVLARRGEQEFALFASGAWALYQQVRSRLDVQAEARTTYLFQVAGPTSLQTLESATGESLRDVGFLRFRNTQVAGHTTEIMRVGMAGSLGYELHGPIEDGPAVWSAVVEAGREYGLQRLGWQAYPVNHVEGGFPQHSWTFLGAAWEDEGFRAFVAATDPGLWPAPRISGSVDPADQRARYRTPVEVGWERTVRLDHDFIGRAAVEREMADPRRTIVTLAWNAEDVIDIYASLFGPGEEYTTLELPSSPNFRGILAHADHVLKDGRQVGIASGTIYSYHYRQVLSHCTLERDCADIGTEVLVQWGRHGGRIKDVRARVERFPYLDEGRNQTVDLGAVPSGVRDGPGAPRP